MARKVYLASSWRNPYQPAVLYKLQDAGHCVYDFRNPKPGDRGFQWSQIDPEWEKWTPEAYREALSNPIAEDGFLSDFDAMEWADTGVLLLPCGRSAHLEAGYFVGARKELYILLYEETVIPELMYKMANGICVNMRELLEALR